MDTSSLSPCSRRPLHELFSFAPNAGTVEGWVAYFRRDRIASLLPPLLALALPLPPAEQVAHELLRHVPELVLVLARVVLERRLRHVPEPVGVPAGVVGDPRGGALGNLLGQVAWFQDGGRRGRGGQGQPPRDDVDRVQDHTDGTRSLPSVRYSRTTALTHLVIVLPAKLGHALLHALIDFDTQISKLILEGYRGATGKHQ